MVVRRVFEEVLAWAGLSSVDVHSGLMLDIVDDDTVRVLVEVSMAGCEGVGGHDDVTACH